MARPARRDAARREAALKASRSSRKEAMTRPVPARLVKLSVALAAALLLPPAPPAPRAQGEQTPEERPRLEHGLDEGYPPWHLPSDAPSAELDALRARWEAIDEELKTTGSEFAGTYWEGGEMRQHVVRFAPRSGFVIVHVYENFAVTDFSYGGVEVTPSEIIFRVEREQQGESSDKQPRTTPRRWVAARWMRSNYLVPAESIADFGDYVAGLGAFNDLNGPCCEFTPFLASPARVDPGGDFERPVVPARYERFIKRPVEATIRRVGRKRRVKDYGSEGEFYSHLHRTATLTPVRIDAGSRHGVRRGLLFRLTGPPGTSGFEQYLKITRVRPDSSDGVVVRDLDDDGRETFYDRDADKHVALPPVAAGTRVTTRPR